MNFWGKTKRFLEPAMEKQWLYIWLSGISVTFAIGSSYLQIYMIQVFTHLFASDRLSSFSYEAKMILSLITFCILAAFLMRAYSWIYPQFGMSADLTRKYLTKYIVTDNHSVENIGTGRMIAIFRGIESWSVLLNEGLMNIFRWGVMLIFGGIMLGQVKSIYAIGFLCLFGVLILNVIFFANRGHKWKKLRKEVHVEETNYLVRSIMSKFEILQSHKLEEAIRCIEEKIILRAEYSKKSHTWGFGTWQLSRLIIAGFTIGICGLFYIRGQNEGISKEFIAEIGTVLGLMATFNGYFHILTEWYVNFLKEFVHIEKLWNTFDSLKPINNYSTGENFLFKQGNFTLKNLNFSYNNSTEVLSQFSLSIVGGKRTALVGRSGSGKTTLMKLLAGYMAPTSGELLIDGQDITSIRLDSYYPHIGYLTQEPSVFDGTIEENLLFGTRKKPTKKDIEKAISLSECQFIYELEHGLGTEIGERGVRLSGGQKQRLAIAKIFLKNPEIILLDEPTAALDSYSEEKVAKAFEHLFEGRTVIVIAHRLQTVKSADDIIVLEKGKIAERGTHKQLLKLGGKYAGMVDLQSGVVREEDNEESYEK